MAQTGIPVILDTDIGGDFDDTWALAMLLKCPELDLRLVTSATGDIAYRTKVAAKLLEAAGRADVPVGMGVPTEISGNYRWQVPWVAGYDLDRYPGKVHEDGVGALIETVMASREKVKLICIGALTNVAEALRREPRIAEKADFVGMHGCIGRGHGGEGVIAESNVKADAGACQKVFAAPWKKTITPLDSCDCVRLAGAKYRAWADSPEPLARALIESYEIWKRCCGWVVGEGVSSTLFDCVAVYLAFSEELLDMRRMNLVVTDDGFTREDPAGHEVRVALAWKDLVAWKDLDAFDAFENLIVERLTGKKLHLGRPAARTSFVQTWRVSKFLPRAGRLDGLAYPADPVALKFSERTFPAQFCDLHAEIGPRAQEDPLIYFACRLICPEPMKLAALFGYDGPVKLWVDRQEKFFDPNGTNPAITDMRRIPFTASAGTHEVLVALGSNAGRAWGIYLRFLRLDVPMKLLRKGPGAYSMPTIAS